MNYHSEFVMLISVDDADADKARTEEHVLERESAESAADNAETGVIEQNGQEGDSDIINVHPTIPSREQSLWRCLAITWKYLLWIMHHSLRIGIKLSKYHVTQWLIMIALVSAVDKVSNWYLTEVCFLQEPLWWPTVWFTQVNNLSKRPCYCAVWWNQWAEKVISRMWDLAAVDFIPSIMFTIGILDVIPLRF